MNDYSDFSEAMRSVMRPSSGRVSIWTLNPLPSACAQAFPMRIAAANHAERTYGSDGVNGHGHMKPVRNRRP